MMSDWPKAVIVVAGIFTVGFVLFFSPEGNDDMKNAFITALITIVGLVFVGKQDPPSGPQNEDQQQDVSD